MADTICQGVIPTEHDDLGNRIFYLSKAEAQREVLDHFLEYQRLFLAGEWSFDDAMVVDHFVRKVEILPDGSLRDASGNTWGAKFEV